MDRSLYTSMTGAQAIMQAQTAIANNLANINTAGFKSDYASLQSFYLKGDGYSTRVAAGTLSQGSQLTSGPLQNTERDLDIALADNNWLVVKNSQEQEAYTKRGDLTVNPEGLLTTGSGQTVVGEGGEISIPQDARATITKDGLVMITTPAQKEPIQINKLKIVQGQPHQVRKGHDGLFYSRQATDLNTVDNAKVSTGVLEGSNVSAIDALVGMIDLARNFELHLKMMEDAKENDTKAAQVIA